MARRSRSAADLATWLGKSATPLFVLDPQRRIRLFNAGCQALTGWSAADVVGEVCHYGQTADTGGPQALAASICPPPEAFQGREVVMPGCVVRKDAGAVSRLLMFVPLVDAEGRTTGVLGAALPPAELPAASPLPPERQLHAELAAIRGALRARFGSLPIIARSNAMRRVVAQIELAAKSTVCALLVGEPGSGREHAARAIHQASAQRACPFVVIDCRRTAYTELEHALLRLLAECAAHEGAGASTQPGTVYLADVDHLPRDMQRALCERWLLRPESERPAARLLASAQVVPRIGPANSPLREDFAALISPLMIEIPALRERTEETSLLAQQFLEQLNVNAEQQVAGFSDTVWPLFTRYLWPGNLDELAAVVREAKERCQGKLISPADLPYRFRAGLEAQQQHSQAAGPILMDELLERVERRLISMSLARAKQNKARAAEWLGISRARLLRRIEQLKLENPGGLGASLPVDEAGPRPEAKPGNSAQDL